MKLCKAGMVHFNKLQHAFPIFITKSEEMRGVSRLLHGTVCELCTNRVRTFVLCSADSISSDEEEMRTLGSSGSESSTPDKTATAASIFTEQSNLVSKCKRFEQKYRMALEQKVASVGVSY